MKTDGKKDPKMSNTPEYGRLGGSLSPQMTISSVAGAPDTSQLRQTTNNSPQTHGSSCHQIRSAASQNKKRLLKNSSNLRDDIKRSINVKSSIVKSRNSVQNCQTQAKNPQRAQLAQRQRLTLFELGGSK